MNQDTKNHTHSFETDVTRLLDIVANALYSNTDVFLRELISNAADACDRLRYDSLSQPELTQNSAPFHIRITPDNNDHSLTIADNGIGMDKDDLIANLGTIARSGTGKILEQLKEQGQDKDLSLIGQFGVGFYASFMVAKQVQVISRKAGSDKAWHWESDGQSGFNIREATSDEAQKITDPHGTIIILSLKKEGIDYLLEDKITQIIHSYSDHIDVPIYLNDKFKSDEENAGADPINTASALWTRAKKDITTEQYNEFYHHIGHAFDDPSLTIHWRAEGKFEYTGLLFIPTMRPWDLYDPDRKSALRLYVKRVFISDQLDNLLYPWLRFVRGVIDTQDLPLNISREMLQTNPVVHKMRSGVTRKVLSEIYALSNKDEEAFLTLWQQFGMVIKEGLYDALEFRDDIFKICRFASTHEAGKLTALDDYIERMKDGQDTIYYMTGENAETLRNSPQLEGFKARGLEVLLMTDTVDEFWLQQVGEFKGKKFQSVTKGEVDISAFDLEKDADKKASDGEELSEDKSEKPSLRALVAYLTDELKGQVSFVRLSKRLTDSPVCLVADEGGVDMHMEKVLKLQQKYEPGIQKVLEINPDHALIEHLRAMHEKEEGNPLLKDSAQLLMDQALIIQGENVSDPAGFTRRMTDFMQRGLVG